MRQKHVEQNHETHKCKNQKHGSEMQEAGAQETQAHPAETHVTLRMK